MKIIIILGIIGIVNLAIAIPTNILAYKDMWDNVPLALVATVTKIVAFLIIIALPLEMLSIKLNIDFLKFIIQEVV